MFIALRKSIIIYLVILQSVAPLVHAHTDSVSLDHGLHVPGLELFMPDHGLVSVQATSYHGHEHGLLVSIDTGIRLDFSLIDDVDDKVIAQKTIPQNQTLLCYQINFSPHQQQPSSTFTDNSQHSRAPPVPTLL